MGTNNNTDYSTVTQAITSETFLKFVTDNVYDNVALLNKLKMDSKVNVRDFGVELQVPLQLTKNTNVQAIDGFQLIKIDPQKGKTNATYAKSFYSVTAPIAKTEIEKNAGGKVVDLVTSEVQNAIDSMNDRINADLYDDGTADAGNALVGFKLMVPFSSTAGTYAGLNPATAGLTNWKHKYNSGATANILTLLDGLYYSLTDGKRKPNLMMASPIGMQVYENALRTASLPLAQVVSLGDGGFKLVNYKGIEIILDQAFTDYSATLPSYLLLNTEYLGFFFKAGMMEEVPAQGQQAIIYQALHVAQLVTSQRRAQGRLDITS